MCIKRTFVWSTCNHIERPRMECSAYPSPCDKTFPLRVVYPGCCYKCRAAKKSLQPMPISTTDDTAMEIMIRNEAYLRKRPGPSEFPKPTSLRLAIARAEEFLCRRFYRKTFWSQQYQSNCIAHDALLTAKQELRSALMAEATTEVQHQGGRLMWSVASGGIETASTIHPFLVDLKSDPRNVTPFLNDLLPASSGRKRDAANNGIVVWPAGTKLWSKHVNDTRIQNKILSKETDELSIVREKNDDAELLDADQEWPKSHPQRDKFFERQLESHHESRPIQVLHPMLNTDEEACEQTPYQAEGPRPATRRHTFFEQQLQTHFQRSPTKHLQHASIGEVHVKQTEGESSGTTQADTHRIGLGISIPARRPRSFYHMPNISIEEVLEEYVDEDKSVDKPINVEVIDEDHPERVVCPTTDTVPASEDIALIAESLMVEETVSQSAEERIVERYNHDELSTVDDDAENELEFFGNNENGIAVNSTDAVPIINHLKRYLSMPSTWNPENVLAWGMRNQEIFATIQSGRIPRTTKIKVDSLETAMLKLSESTQIEIEDNVAAPWSRLDWRQALAQMKLDESLADDSFDDRPSARSTSRASHRCRSRRGHSVLRELEPSGLRQVETIEDMADAKVEDTCSEAGLTSKLDAIRFSLNLGALSNNELAAWMVADENEQQVRSFKMGLAPFRVPDDIPGMVWTNAQSTARVNLLEFSTMDWYEILEGSGVDKNDG